MLQNRTLFFYCDLGYAALTCYAHDLTRAANHGKAAAICLLGGSIALVPSAIWFSVGAIGYYEFAQRGGRLDMLGLTGVLFFSILFSVPLLWAVYLLFWGLKLLKKSRVSQK
jgi:hypothetical protein